MGFSEPHPSELRDLPMKLFSSTFIYNPVANVISIPVSVLLVLTLITVVCLAESAPLWPGPLPFIQNE